MRSSATRIVFAALAVIVGVVLALPILLSRKAEAGTAAPLAADAHGIAGAALRSRSPEAQPGDLTDAEASPLLLSEDSAAAACLALDQVSTCQEPTSPCPPRLDRQAAQADLPPPWRSFGLNTPDLPIARILFDAVNSEPVPPALTLVSERRYHLRP